MKVMEKKMRGMVFLFLIMSVWMSAQAGFIVETTEPAVLRDFISGNGSSVEPLISYPNPSPEVNERVGNYWVVKSDGRLKRETISNLAGVSLVITDKRNRQENTASSPPVSSNPFYPADTVLYDYHIPNDTHFHYQWDRIITETHWAWELEKGSGDVIVAILDTGIDTLHEDLSANFTGGYDFVATSASIQDVYGHGTSVSGVIAAQIDNEKGIAGISQSGIMMLKIVDDDGYYVDSDLIEGIYYAANTGANVISMSLIGDEKEPISLIQNAITYAWDRGCFLVAIAGNSGRNGSVYPGAYERVMSVGSTNQDDNWADHSNYGDGVTVFAPGQYIYSTRNGNRYKSESGTSMAGPQIAGLAALIWSYYPTYTNQDVWDKIIQTADTIMTDMGEMLRMNSRKALGITPDVDEEQSTSMILATLIDNNVLELSYSRNTPYSISVFDATGRRVAFEKGYSKGKITLSLTDLSEGVYFWSFVTPPEQATGKFLILK